MGDRLSLPLALLLAVLFTGCHGAAPPRPSLPKAPHAPVSLYYLSGAAALHALNAADGLQRWSYAGTTDHQPSVPGLSPPVLAQDVIYLGDSGVTALQAVDGQ